MNKPGSPTANIRPPSPDGGFLFNVDLLLTDSDRESFRKHYPKLFFAFDDPELRDLFLPLDKAALGAKRRARTWGVTAVLLLSVALMTSAVDMLMHGEKWFNYLIIGAGVAGILGVVIGFGGVMTAGSKEKWLRQRFLCERIRQLHFQTLVRWAPMIVEASRTGDHTEFLAARSARTGRFQMQVVNMASAQLSPLLSDRSEGDMWLVDDRTAPIPPSPEATTFFQVLEDMRLRHQINYAEMQLRPDTSALKPSPLHRARMLSDFAAFCVIAILALHLASVAGALHMLSSFQKTLVHVLTLCLAVAALAARTLEEGFQAQREVERYRAVSSAFRIIREHYDAAESFEERREAMIELEEVCYEEMVNFLRAHNEARFVM